MVMIQCLWGVDMAIKTRYRIVTDDYNGYEAQVKHWFFPFFWFEINQSNTSTTIEKAEAVIEKYKFKSKVVKYIE